VRSLGGLLLHQTQAKEFQVINANLVSAVSEAGLIGLAGSSSSSTGYINNGGENVSDEKQDRVALAKLVEFAKGSLPSMVHNLSTTLEMKKQMEVDFRDLMSKIVSFTPSPLWNIHGDLVLTKADKKGFPQKLGSGGYGTVYLSHFLDQAVAKKIFEGGDDFDPREVEVCFVLRHPNIVRLLGASASDDPPCLYFELSDGPSLRRVFSSSTSVPSELKTKISLEIASGMTYLHSQNPIIIHRDLKPDNILLTSSLQVKIIDFGLSVFHKASQSARTQTKAGAGTEAYSSPEVLLNRKIDRQVDVWSFGMTLYELWSGIVPWRNPAKPSEIIITNIAEELREKRRPFLDIASIPAPLRKLIGLCWQEEPRMRPEFASIYCELSVSEFQQMESQLKSLSLNSSSPSTTTSGGVSQAVYKGFFFFPSLKYYCV
jgi:hypothetical protein